MIIAAVTCKNELCWTAPLVEGLLVADQVDEVWLYDNGSTDNTRAWAEHRALLDPRLKFFDMSHLRLFHMWNDMINRAKKIGGVKLAILNNDLRLPFNAIKAMADLVGEYQIVNIDPDKDGFSPIGLVYPEQINWWERDGYAFVLDVDFWKYESLAIAPTLKIWWGDDDLYRRCQARGGKIARARGVGCNHAVSQTDGHYVGDKWRDVEEDRDEFVLLWS